MKKIVVIFILCIITPLFAGEPVSVSVNKRYLVDANGKPFFWLGDTAWELFHRLNRQEADVYLQNRAEKGFTVIQAVILAELDGLNTGNAYGEKPLLDNDPAKPNEKYFQHVDYIVNQAAKLGLVIAMLPTWGDKYNKQWGVGPEVFTPENAQVFGAFVAKRYKDKPIIWILGGDRNPADDEDRMITDALAKGIRMYDKKHLITYHPTGASMASDYYLQSEWLDLDFYQSGHHKRLDPHYLISFNKKSLALEPQHPVINGEPNYEDHPVNWLSNGERGWFDDFDCRYAAYISMLTGACGHTYGDHAIWQMWQPGREPISFVRTKWHRAMDYPGAFQMGYMRQLFESLPWEKLITGTYQILNADPASFQLCTLSEDRQFMVVYTADGTELTVNLDDVQPDKVTATWFNPRDGERALIGEFATTGSQTFKPHSFGRGSDWILIIK